MIYTINFSQLVLIELSWATPQYLELEDNVALGRKYKYCQRSDEEELIRKFVR